MAFNGHGNFIFGVTDAVWLSALGLVRGVGVKRGRASALGPRSSYGLIEPVECGFIEALTCINDIDH